MYSSNWVDQPLQTKKDVFVYMEYLKRDTVMKAGNYFTIGLGIFTEVIFANDKKFTKSNRF